MTRRLQSTEKNPTQQLQSLSGPVGLYRVDYNTTSSTQEADSNQSREYYANLQSNKKPQTYCNTSYNFSPQVKQNFKKIYVFIESQGS